MVQYKEGNSIYGFHYNHRGDVSHLTDSDQNIAQHYEHDAWGVRLASESTLENPIQYQACAWLKSPVPGAWSCSAGTTA